MPTTRRNSIYYPSIAKQYIDDIKVIRSLLREKRNEYKLAKNRNDITEMNKKKVEFDEIWKTQWPYYNGMERVSYSLSA